MKATLKYFLPGLLLTGLSVFVVIENNDFWSWMGLVFCGLITLMYLLKLLFPNAAFLKKIQTNSAENDDRSFDEIYEDNGIFDFQEDGFIIRLKKEPCHIKWEELQSVLGYKIDLYATDCICAEVYCDNGKSFKITEETRGWFQFQKHLKDRFPDIDKTWDIEISTPAFETNLTLVYDRDKRTLEEVIKQQ